MVATVLACAGEMVWLASDLSKWDTRYKKARNKKSCVRRKIQDDFAKIWTSGDPPVLYMGKGSIVYFFLYTVCVCVRARGRDK